MTVSTNLNVTSALAKYYGSRFMAEGFVIRGLDEYNSL